MAKVSINGLVVGVIEVTKDDIIKLQNEGFTVEIR